MALLPIAISAQVSQTAAEASLRNANGYEPNHALRIEVLTTSDAKLGSMILGQDRIRASYALTEAANRRHPGLVPFLAKTMETHFPTDPNRSANAAGVLGRFPGQAPLLALRRALTIPRLPVRLTAATTLVSRGDGTGVNVLIEGVAKGDAEQVYEAANALRRLGRTETSPAIAIRAKTLTYAREPKLWMVLAAMGNREGCEEVTRTMRSAAYSGTRAHCAIALGWSGNRNFTKSLVAALMDRSSDTRRCAAEALAHMGDRRALPGLRRALEQNAPDAANARRGNELYHDAVRETIRILESGRPKVWKVVEVAWQYGPPHPLRR